MAVMVLLFAGCAGSRHGQDNRIEQALTFPYLGTDTVERPNRTEGVDHLTRNQFNGPVAFRCPLQGPHLRYRFGEAVRRESGGQG